MQSSQALTRALAEAQERHAERTRFASVRYRVYVSYKLTDADADYLACDIVARYFAGATITKARGLWQGDREASLIVELLAHPSDFATVRKLAEHIRNSFAQECVIVSADRIRAELV